VAGDDDASLTHSVPMALPSGQCFVNLLVVAAFFISVPDVDMSVQDKLEL
jgi:hypothetical protein